MSDGDTTGPGGALAPLVDQTALAMVASGASRIGTSRGLDLVGCSRPLPDPLHVFLVR